VHRACRIPLDGKSTAACILNARVGILKICIDTYEYNHQHEITLSGDECIDTECRKVTLPKQPAILPYEPNQNAKLAKKCKHCA
jgi:hypothetical protein